MKQTFEKSSEKGQGQEEFDRAIETIEKDFARLRKIGEEINKIKLRISSNIEEASNYLLPIDPDYYRNDEKMKENKEAIFRITSLHKKESEFDEILQSFLL